MAGPSSVDKLTGLPSRRALLRDFESSIAWVGLTTPVSVVLFDVDQTQLLNERLGREAVDGLLRSIVGLFKGLPGTGSRVCRHGGDSFLCVLPGAPKAIAIIFADKLRAALEAAHPGVTLSAGVATAPKDAAGLQPLIRAATLVLAEAKKTGRNRVLSVGQVQKSELWAALPTPLLLGRDAEIAAAGKVLEGIRN